jgi:hypothetical protein
VALVTERAAREREIDILQRQTELAQRQRELAGAGLRTVVVPDNPAIRAFRKLPNGSARMDVALTNQSESLALKGRLSMSAWIGPPPIFPFDIIASGGEERFRASSFEALRAGGQVVLHATVPRVVIKEGPQRLGFTSLITTRQIGLRELSGWSMC